MQFIVLLSLLVEIFVSTKAAKPRSINVALDTVFEFDKSSDLDFINKVQGILTKVKNKIKDNPKQDDNEYTMRVKQYKFTNFLEDLIDTVLSFNDKDLIEIVQIVKNEIRENKHGDALPENMRRFLNNELNLIKVKTIRKDLDKLVRKLQNPSNVTNNNILGFINTLYKRDTQKKLLNFIRKLKIFRQNSRKSGQLQHTVKRAVQHIIIDYFSNLSEDTKRKVEARLKDYLLGDFSTAHYDKIYPLKIKQPHKFTIEPKLVLQNSEDTNTEETIEIEEKGFKSHRNIHIPYLIQDRSEYSEISTKTLNKNEIVNIKQNKVSDEEVISIEKVTKKETHVTSEGGYTNSKYSTDTTRQITNPKSKRSYNKKNRRKSKTTELSTRTYLTNKFLKEAMPIKKVAKKESNDETSKERYDYDGTPEATYLKPRRSHTKKSKKRSKNASIKYSKEKLTRITLYPGNIQIEKRSFRALKMDKNNKAKNRRTLDDDVTLSSLSNSAEINVSLKNNKIRFVYDDNKKNNDIRKDALMEVRAFRQKLMESRTTGDTKFSSEHHSENLNIKRNEITTPKPSLSYFGNLFKSNGVTVEESDSRHFDDSDINDTHFFGEIDDRIETRNIKNINKVTTIITRHKLDGKQTDFRATYADNDFQEKADSRLSKLVAEDKSAKKPKTVDITKKYYFLTTSRYIPISRKDSNIAENKSDKFKATEITTESYDRLAEELDNEEIISNKNIKTNEIATKNYEELEEYHFMENKQERNLTTIEIPTGDIFLNNKSYRRTEKPKLTDKVSLNITKNYINVISKTNTDMDTKAELKSNFDYNMGYTTIQKIKNANGILPPNQPNTKVDKINKKRREGIVYDGTKTTNKIVENQPTHRKIIFKQLTKKLQELSTKFTEKVTKNEGMNKISKHINLGTDMQEKQYETTKTQSEFKSSNLSSKINNLRLEIKSNHTEVHDLRRKPDSYSKVTANINKKNKPKIGDAVKIINTQIVDISGQTNVNPKIATKSYNKDIKPINESRRQLNMNSKATTVLNDNEELDANFKGNNKISTIPVDIISLDIKGTKSKDIKHNNTIVNDRKKSLQTTPLVDFKDELLDTEFKEEIKKLENNPVPIDIQKYIKNPEVADVTDEKKKKEIEQKMKEELSNLFTSPVTIATTTAAYTDIFEAIDDEFGLDPLK